MSPCERSDLRAAPRPLPPERPDGAIRGGARTARVAADGRLPGGPPAGRSPSRGDRPGRAPRARRRRPAGWASSSAPSVVAFLLGFFSLAQTVGSRHGRLRHGPPDTDGAALDRELSTAGDQIDLDSARQNVLRQPQANGLDRTSAAGQPLRVAWSLDRPMLGRTDSAGAASSSCSGARRGGAGAGGPPGLLAGAGSRELVDLATQQTQTSQTRSPSSGATIYDRSGTVVLATTVDRYVLVADPDQLTPAQVTHEANDPDVRPRPRLTRMPRPAPEALHGPHYVVLSPALTSTRAPPIRAGLAANGADRWPGSTSNPSPTASTPDPGGAPDTTLAAQLLGFVNRDGVGPVRRRAVLPGRARRPAQGRRWRPRRSTASRCLDTAQVVDAGHARPGPPA